MRSFSASARQTQPPTSAVLNSALYLIFLPPPLYYRLLLHILFRIVLGRTRFGYCFGLFLKFIIHMYAPSYLKCYTDEGCGRNVYKNVFFLSLYIYVYVCMYVCIYVYVCMYVYIYINSKNTTSCKRFGVSLHQSSSSVIISHIYIYKI